MRRHIPCTWCFAAFLGRPLHAVPRPLRGLERKKNGGAAGWLVMWLGGWVGGFGRTWTLMSVKAEAIKVAPPMMSSMVPKRSTEGSRPTCGRGALSSIVRSHVAFSARVTYDPRCCSLQIASLLASY